MTEFIESEAIKASAGCGKTYYMTLRLLAMIIKQKNEVENFFRSANTMTFTKAATAEIYTNLLKHVYSTLKQESYAELNSSLKKFNVPEVGKEDLIEILKYLLYNMSIIKISTIDSFMNSVVQSFPFELGLPGNCTIVDAGLEQHLKEKIVRKLFTRIQNKDELENLRVSCELASTGEKAKSTLELLQEIIGMMDDLYVMHPDFCYMPYADRLTDEKICKRQNLLKAAYDECDEYFEKNAKNYHESSKVKASLSEVLDKIVNEKLTVKTVFSSSVQKTLGVFFNYWEEFCNGGEVDGYKRGWNFDPVRKQLKSIFELAKDLMITQSAIRAEGICRIYDEYLRLYHEEFYRNGYITFSDLPKLLGNSNNDWNMDIAYRMNNRCAHWLVDEFQDTSRMQWKVLENMVGDCNSEENRSLFLVGDTKQAIYSWRAGDRKLFGEVIDNMDLATAPLDNSYRYGENICNAINHIFDGERVCAGGIVVADTAKAWKEIFEKHVSAKNYKSDFRCIELDDTTSYAEAIYKKIKELQIVEKDYTCAILVRRKNEGIDLAKQLTANYPELKNKVIWEGDETIADDKFLTAIVALLIYLQHPASTVHREVASMDMAVRHLVPKNDVELRELNEELSNKGIYFMVRKFIDRLKKLHTLHSTDEAEDIYNFLTLDNINNLLSAAKDFANHNACCDAIEFEKFIQSRKLKNITYAGKIRVMTIFHSKGLTFDFCFYAVDATSRLQDSKDISKLDFRHTSYLLDTENQNLFYPMETVLAADERLKNFMQDKLTENCFEDLCVAYVAMTRAKYGMYVILPALPKKNGCKISDFIRSAFENSDGGYDFDRFALIGSEEWKVGEKITPKKFDFSFAETEKIGGNLRRKRFNPSKLDDETDLAKRTLYFNLPNEKIGSLLGDKVHELFAQIIDISKFEVPQNTEDEVKLHVFNCIKNREIQELLSSDNSDDVWIEKKFDCILNDGWISGCFDRVNLMRDEKGSIVRAELIDYKSSIVDEESYDLKLQNYKRQLELYRSVLAKLLKLSINDIECNIIFTGVGKLEKF